MICLPLGIVNTTFQYIYNRRMCAIIAVGDNMTRDTVLAILKRAEGFASGEEISRALGVSRAAVNGAVKALRREGYEIESATNRGYRLINAPDRLTSGELSALLPAERMKTVLCLDSVDSTNDCLRTLAQEGAPDGQIVLANRQTKGRGRMGRPFQSPADTGVYMSVLLRPDSAPADISGITAWAAEAMCSAVNRVCGERPGIKWINDLVMGGKKVCGILTELSIESESSRVQFVIIGCGVNANEAEGDFPPELSNIAGSVYSQTGKRIKRAELAACMIEELDALRSAWPGGKRKYLDAYKRDCLTPGNKVLVISGAGEREAFADSVDDDFRLVVILPDGSREAVSSGEVSVRGLYGYT